LACRALVFRTLIFRFLDYQVLVGISLDDAVPQPPVPREQAIEHILGDISDLQSCPIGKRLLTRIHDGL
jgi:hypothetical protein